MKMGDGGFRPAYNVQFATDGASQVIVGAGVVTVGSDQGQMTPMIEQVKERTGEHPEQWLVDGGYNKHEEIEAASKHTEVYSPVPQPKTKGKGKDNDENKDAAATEAREDACEEAAIALAAPAAGPAQAAAQAKTEVPAIDRHQPRSGDSAAVAAWRVRMGTEEAKAIYKNRAASVECVNAHARNRGLTRLMVRGTDKARCVVLLHAVAHNVMRMLALAPQLLGIGTGTSSASNLAVVPG